MEFYADLHLHSKYSRATAKSCDLEHLALWARKKGITVVGTGDFTHPGWRAELTDQLEPAEPGLFRLTPRLERQVHRGLPAACRGTVRFVLSAEISTIYKKNDRTRKVHHVVYAPDLGRAGRISEALARIGNVQSDGRPILGLDSRDLLEIVLEAGGGCYLVPAHIWTPWFSALGSKSGFDSIDECYGDLASTIFAVETGLSSDPAMNWQVSCLDRFRLVSNSDAHSPPMLGREACIFDGAVDYHGIRHALETGEGYVGTVEFFPEEGKYHLDGHRNCGVRLTPTETRQLDGRCPACGKPVTIGVMHRVAELADRADEAAPATAGCVRSFVPLPEMLSELRGVGSKSKSVQRALDALLAELGPELDILGAVPVEKIRRVGGELLAEAVERLRAGRVIRRAGYDGEYGVIRLFSDEELATRRGAGRLFDLPGVAAAAPSPTAAATAPPSPATGPPSIGDHESRRGAAPPSSAVAPERPSASERTLPLFGKTPGAEEGHLLAGLDDDQRAAAEIREGPLLIVAGPGSGKTRTLTRRIAHLVSHHQVPPEQCLTITFTRRAAEELSERLGQLLPDRAPSIPVHTFHRLGLSIVREHAARVGLSETFRIADPSTQVSLLADALGTAGRRAERMLRRISHAKRSADTVEDEELTAALEAYERTLRERELVDFDDLVRLPVALLESHPDLAEAYRRRFRYLSIDEYQDVDARQYRLVRALVPPDGNVCAIGDPHQAIYGFRGADVAFFHRFEQDFPAATVVRLRRNYRSGRPIVVASTQVLERSPEAAAAPATVPGSSMYAVQPSGPQVTIHEARTERAEAEFVVHTIEQLLGGHSFFSVDSGRSDGAETCALSFSDVAILYRTESQAGPLTEALDRSGMPFQCRSHDALMAQPGVMALVKLMLASSTTGSVHHRLRAAAVGAVARAGGAPPAPEQPSAAVTATNAAVLQRALELLTPLAEHCGHDAERFTTELALGAEMDSWDPRADRIALLTLHAAKGLEFPVVFIVGCEEGILPLRFGAEPQEDDPEERRLFYVGMTRARLHLLLCHARRRAWRGKVRPAQPSPYLRAIEEDLLVHSKTRQASRPEPIDKNQLKLF